MLISKFGTASRQSIIETCGDVPEELISFLEKYNGGETPETTFSIGNVSSNIVAFYGIGDVKYSYAQIDKIDHNGHLYLPIAFDSFGNRIAISLQDGKIVFQNHEKESDLVFLCQNLGEFINRVESKKISPKHLRTIKEREEDFIRRGKGNSISDALRSMWQSEIDKFSGYHQEPVAL